MSDNLGNISDYVIARSKQLPSNNMVSVTLNVSHSIWTLSVSPERGWYPTWWPYVVAAVVVMSIFISLLIAFVMIARKQQSWMLIEVVVRWRGGA